MMISPVANMRRIGVSSRVTGFIISPRLSNVNAPSRGVESLGANTTFEVPLFFPSSKKPSPIGYLRFVPSASVNSSRSRGSDPELPQDVDRRDAVDRSRVDEKIQFDRSDPRPARIGQLDLCEGDSHRPRP